MSPSDDPTLFGVLFIVAGMFVLCALLWFCYSARDWLRRLRGKHRADCACEPCWQRYVAGLRRVHVDDQVRAARDESRGRRQLTVPWRGEP